MLRTVKANICGEHQGQDTASCAWCRIAKLREENQRLRNCIRSCEDCDPDGKIMAGIQRRAKIEVLREVLAKCKESVKGDHPIIQAGALATMIIIQEELKQLEGE